MRCAGIGKYLGLLGDGANWLERELEWPAPIAMKFVRWILRCFCRECHAKAPNGSEAVVGLQTAFFAVIGGLLLYIQGDKAPRDSVLMLYGAACAVPLGAMALLVLLPGRRGYYPYDRNTTVYALISAIVLAGAAYCVGNAYVKENLPGQGVKQVRLTASDPEEKTWEDAQDKEGVKKQASKIVVPFRFNSRQLGVALRDPQDVEIKLSQKIAWSWELAGTIAYRIVDGQREEFIPQVQDATPVTRQLLVRIRDRSADYILEVRLRQRSHEISPQKLVEMIKEDREGLVSTILILEHE